MTTPRARPTTFAASVVTARFASVSRAGGSEGIVTPRLAKCFAPAAIAVSAEEAAS